MRALGKRAILAHNLAKPQGAEANGAGALYRVGAAAVRLHAATPSIAKKPRHSRWRRCCNHLIFGEDIAAVRQHSSKQGASGAQHMQTLMERNATRLIEGIHKKGVACFSDDHELAMNTDGVLCGLVIKRQAVLDDLSLRM